MIWSGRQFRGVVLGDKPADRNARKVIQQRQHRIENRAADILEIDIDAIRTGCFQIFAQLGLAMIEARVESELVPNEAAALELRRRFFLTQRPTQFRQGDILELTDSLSGKAKLLSHFLEGLRFATI